MTKISNKIIIIMFIIFLFGINILNIMTPDKDFSEFENRMLSKRPKVNFKNILSGRFTDKFEKYVTDQFVYREFWVSIKSDIERLTLKSENKGIFFGRDGYLLEHYKKPEELLEQNVHSINMFSEKLKDVSTYLLLAPNSVKVYEDKLPLYAVPYDQLKTINRVKNNLNEDVKFVDAYNLLQSKKDQYIYFRTDHHWTMRGAYYAYQALAKQLGIQPYTMEDFNSEIVTDSFYGTYYSKASNRHINPDFIEIFKPKFDVEYEVYFADENRYVDSLYELQHLETKDKYSIFLDGNHSLSTIKTNVKNNKKLVIFKDSYSHCFIPFLANHYEEIHIIDLRYYKLSVYDYIKEHDIREALLLYNISTFSGDDNIRLLR